jgi:hypothetical protein
MQLLITGAIGKVGVNLIGKMLLDPRWREGRLRVRLKTPIRELFA